MAKNPKNTCFNCRFEVSCGYSMLAQLGKRLEDVKTVPCCLGMKTSGKPFFQPKAGAALWDGCDPENPEQFFAVMASRGHADFNEFASISPWHLTDEGRAALGME